jgi:hypothetical protein
MIPRRTTVGLVLASMFLVFLACNDSPTDPDDSVGFQTVLKGSFPGAPPDLAGREAVRDQATWEEVWVELHGLALAPPPPAIDFRREMVIVVVGPGCNGIVTVSSVASLQGQLLVTAEGEACSNALAVCAIADFSVHIIRVPRLNLPVRVDMRDKGKLC